MDHGVPADATEAGRALERKLSKPYPIGRLGWPDDVAPRAVLLWSGAAAWITGQAYPVDGGSPAQEPRLPYAVTERGRIRPRTVAKIRD